MDTKGSTASSVDTDSLNSQESQSSLEDSTIDSNCPFEPINHVLRSAQTNRELLCPFYVCVFSTCYDREAFESHIHGHRAGFTPYVDRTEEDWAACPFCIKKFNDGEEFRGHMIDHSRNDFPKITEEVERISKLYDPYFPQKQEEEITMIRQPDVGRISEQQCEIEAQKIYKDVEMAEKEYQLHDKDDMSNVVALQRSMLHNYYDFLLVTQHPDAPEIMRDEAARLGIPARIWDQGIHPALGLLRAQLPASFEHMKCMIPFSYSMLTLLQEQFPKFQSTWIDYKRRLEEYCLMCGVAPGWAPVEKKASHI